MDIKQIHQRLKLYTIVIIFALTAFWFNYYIQVYSSWYDEVITLFQISGNPAPVWTDGIVDVDIHKQNFSGNVSPSELVTNLTQSDVHPPLYFLLLLGWKALFGDALETIRTFSLFSVLLSGIALIYSASIYKKGSEIFSLLFFFSSPIIAWSAVNARDYSLALLFTSLAIITTTALLSSNQNYLRTKLNPDNLIILAATFSGLAFLTHYFTILVTTGLLATIAIMRYKTNLRAISIGTGIFTGIILLTLPMLQVQYGARPHSYSGFQGIFIELAAMLDMLLHIMSEKPTNPILQTPYFLVYISIFIAISGYAIKRFSINRLGIIYLFSLFCFLLGLATLFFINDKSLSGASVNLYRYGVFLSPLLALLFGGFLTALWRKSRTAGLITACILFIFPAHTWSDGQISSPPWPNHLIMKRLIDELNEYPKNKTLVVAPSGHGRGTPGVLAKELPSGTKIIIVDSAEDFLFLKQAHLDWQAILVLGDETGKLNDELSHFTAHLTDQGFQKKHGAFFWSNL